MPGFVLISGQWGCGLIYGLRKRKKTLVCFMSHVPEFNITIWKFFLIFFCIPHLIIYPVLPQCEWRGRWAHIHRFPVLLSFNCQFDKAQSHLRRDPQLKNYLEETGLWTCLWEIVSIANWYWRAQPTMGSTVPRQVVFHYIRNIACELVRSILHGSYWTYLTIKWVICSNVTMHGIATGLPLSSCLDLIVRINLYLPCDDFGQEIFFLSQQQNETRTFSQTMPLPQRLLLFSF